MIAIVPVKIGSYGGAIWRWILGKVLILLLSSFSLYLPLSLHPSLLT